MASTKRTLESITGKLDESIGVRTVDNHPQLSPVPNAKDVGRRALRNFGTLAIETIIPDPTQPRANFDEQEISRLASSLQEKGQLQPILVRWSEPHSKWIIIFGERRYRATLLAGLPTINCQFQESAVDKGEILEQQLIENLLREDLKPIEEAIALDQLLKQNGWTGKELSEAIHISASRITRALALLTLPADIQQLVESGKLAARTAYEISKLPDDHQRRAAVRRGQSTDGHITLSQAQAQVRQRKGKPASKPRGVKQTFITEEGWKVTVAHSRQGNYHELKQALEVALSEVQLRIDNDVVLR